MTIGIAIVGASGKMGRVLIEAALAASDCKLMSAIDRFDSESINLDAGSFLGKKTDVIVQSEIEAGLKKADTLIDFTRPEGTMAHLAICQQLKVSAVIGTTGFTAAQNAKIKEIAQIIPIVQAPNMSVGMNVTFKLLELASQALNNQYDIEISEIHHKYKVDSPSGTALKMGEVIAHAQGRKLEDCAVYNWHDVKGERPPGAIGFATTRAGDVVGDHTAIFAGPGERVEITHKSASRMTYAQGALLAARFLKGKSSGLYDMFDVLNLK